MSKKSQPSDKSGSKSKSKSVDKNKKQDVPVVSKISKIDSEDLSDKFPDINQESDSDGEQQFESEGLGNVKRTMIPDYDSDVDPSKNALSDNDDDFDVDDGLKLTKPEYDSDGSVQFDVAKVLEKKKSKKPENPKSSKPSKNK
jgi:hypothetical protein